MYFAAEIDILSIVLPFFFYFAAQIAALNNVNLFYVKVKTLHAAPSWLASHKPRSGWQEVEGFRGLKVRKRRALSVSARGLFLCPAL